MTEYHLPADYAQSEFTEKKSRFLSQIWPVRTEAEAREKIEAVKKQYHDARHNCWCFALRDGTLRYSDDGEPQGTAGQPMLEVLTRQGVTDAVIVVTRYFGGILLGAGGLTRAYSRGAKDALAAAGVSVERLWDQLLLEIPYSLYERIRVETEKTGGVIEDTDYGAGVTLTVLTPEDATADYLRRLTELTAGKLEAEQLDQVFRAVKVG